MCIYSCLIPQHNCSSVTSHLLCICISPTHSGLCGLQQRSSAQSQRNIKCTLGTAGKQANQVITCISSNRLACSLSTINTELNSKTDPRALTVKDTITWERTRLCVNDHMANVPQVWPRLQNCTLFFMRSVKSCGSTETWQSRNSSSRLQQLSIPPCSNTLVLLISNSYVILCKVYSSDRFSIILVLRHSVLREYWTANQ